MTRIHITLLQFQSSEEAIVNKKRFMMQKNTIATATIGSMIRGDYWFDSTNINNHICNNKYYIMQCRTPYQ